MANTRARTYSPPRVRGRRTKVSYTLILVVLLPILAPVYLTYIFSDSDFAACSIAFVSNGDLALASVFLLAAALCDGVLTGKDIAFEATAALVLAVVAVPIYAKARIHNVGLGGTPDFNFSFWMSIVCYLLSAYLTLGSQALAAEGKK